MEKIEIQDLSLNNPHRELANDVAMLFSWAKMENTPYRDFSRPRKAPSAPIPSAPIMDRAVADGPAKSEADPLPATMTSSVTASVLPESGIPWTTNGTASAQATSPTQRPPAAHPLSGRVAPVVAVYSIAGGVGKTTLAANLGKTLCSLGEQPLLIDVSSRGHLPFHFGATESRAGSRKFVAPGEHAPVIHVLTADAVTNEWLEDTVKHAMSGAQRTIFDIGPLSGGLLSAMFEMSSVILVPLLPDLNSISSVATIEGVLNAHSGGPKPAVYYVFNRFDELKGNDQHARDIVARLCGQRLLPITLRHDWKLTEALHGDLSTADPTPGPELSHDYLELALWVRRIAPLRSAAVLPGRWSEQ
jgi:cellulose biosynthesis protein BcsQ